MVTLAMPIGAAIVFATIYLAVPRLRERHETRRKWRAAERHLQAQQTQRTSYDATETTPSVDLHGWSTIDDAAPDGRPLSAFEQAQEAFRAAWLTPGS